MSCNGRTCKKARIVCFECGRTMSEADFTAPMKRLANEAAGTRGLLNHAVYLLSCYTACPIPGPDKLEIRPLETVTKLKEEEIGRIYKLYEEIESFDRRTRE